MIRLNINQAKSRLSHYLGKVERGEKIVLCKRNVPIAEIRPVARRRKTKRPIGLAKGKVKVPPEFFEPLPTEIINAFHGDER